MVSRVLTWNLKHGLAVPPAGRDLFDEFAAALGGWEWDAALLQEVPPWWPSPLAARLDCEQRLVLTSRNALLPLRRTIAVRWPDLIKSNGGGCNAILVRGDSIVEHRVKRLCLWPERRWLQAVRLHGGGWVANLHATAHDTSAAIRDGRLAGATVERWAGGAPIVLGGDFNLRELSLDGFERAAGHDVDHVFVRGLLASRDARVLERGHLSDHAPVSVGVTSAAGD
jgi:endonuclease/exonuclease/phosphatase family metal-dependent hydrolase